MELNLQLSPYRPILLMLILGTAIFTVTDFAAMQEAPTLLFVIMTVFASLQMKTLLTALMTALVAMGNAIRAKLLRAAQTTVVLHRFSVGMVNVIEGRAAQVVQTIVENVRAPRLLLAVKFAEMVPVEVTKTIKIAPSTVFLHQMNVVIEHVGEGKIAAPAQMIVVLAISIQEMLHQALWKVCSEN